MSKSIKLPNFLNSRWVEMAKQSDAAMKIRKEFPKWIERAKDSELVKRARQLQKIYKAGQNVWWLVSSIINPLQTPIRYAA